ncbi:UvrD-helicase domain-containing protein [uncultured Eubacterium sp.]|uniref:UvrD-helicase domain-containing protein n=1 Tax=uncultured Eubacterium sp. TaxID=165185 RepID=UPI00259174C7|nr:UvrD-helicase domain-containing protein [uncultured Eubacterium sp.]
MEINIAGAGAGKTTKMSDKIIVCYNTTENYKNIYCITFTNNAVSCIDKKLREHFGKIPDRIIVSTIHSFLYQEFIKPYYYLLFSDSFDTISTIKLPDNSKYKNAKIKELKDGNILHISQFSQIAKWVLVKKSTDRKREREIRKNILNVFSKYCAKIFIDEVQDIDENVQEIIQKFNSEGIAIEMMGDPKQDLKGFNCLRTLIDLYPQDVIYINECHRCPQSHLNISNCIISIKEQQVADESIVEGECQIVFESEIEVEEFINNGKFDLKYISEKSDIYDTHENKENTEKFATLYYELRRIMSEIFSIRSELTINKSAYYYAGKMIKEYAENSDANKVIWKNIPFIKGNKQYYARIINALKMTQQENEKCISVNSIDSIKGQEGNNCLFILTTDLAAYLFKQKVEENRTKNKLYVALTRSKNKLTFLITKAVEDKYGKNYISNEIAKMKNRESIDFDQQQL